MGPDDAFDRADNDNDNQNDNSRNLAMIVFFTRLSSPSSLLSSPSSSPSSSSSLSSSPPWWCLLQGYLPLLLAASVCATANFPRVRARDLFFTPRRGSRVLWLLGRYREAKVLCNFEVWWHIHVAPTPCQQISNSNVRKSKKKFQKPQW